MQGDLFLANKEPPAEASAIPGFSLQLDYVTPDEQWELIACVDRGPWETDWRRRIQQYGIGYASEPGKQASWIRDLPAWLVPLAERVAGDAGFERFPGNSVINEYIPPLGIGPHRDYGAFGPMIACVSLSSWWISVTRNAGCACRCPHRRGACGCSGVRRAPNGVTQSLRG